MGCLKCGKETGLSSVFCDECLWKAAAYPVKPDVAIQLPDRLTVAEEKKPPRKKKLPSAEELLKKYRKSTFWLSVSVFLLTVGLVLSISFLIHTADSAEEKDNIGRNYTSVVP